MKCLQGNEAKACLTCCILQGNLYPHWHCLSFCAKLVQWDLISINNDLIWNVHVLLLNIQRSDVQIKPHKCMLFNAQVYIVY